MEHYIQHTAESERVIKITYPAQYGLIMRLMRPTAPLPDQLSDVIGLRPATPLEYLDRMVISQKIFLRGENAYFRAADHFAVFDAHARNFVLTGGVPVPFDVIPQVVTGRMESLLELWL